MKRENTVSKVLLSRCKIKIQFVSFAKIETVLYLGPNGDRMVYVSGLERDYKELVDTPKSLKELNSKNLSLDKHKIDPNKYNSQEGEN